MEQPLWDASNTASCQYVPAGYTSGTPPSVSPLSSGGLTNDTNLSEHAEREYGSYIWGWGDLPELSEVDAAGHSEARPPLASASCPMPPDSDWKSDILSSQRPPEGRDVAASFVYMPPPPPSATPPNLQTDGATPSASPTPPLPRDVGAV